MARSNLNIKVGTYTGDGADSRNITGIGFRPDLVIINGGTNNGVFKTIQMAMDSTCYLTGNIANLADAIQEILNDGFQVGTNALVNANATVYYYLAVKGISAQQYFTTGKYTGNNADDRNFTTGGIYFTPDILYTKGDRADNGSGRIASQVGDTSLHLSGVADAANEIQNLQANGFQLGTSSRVNSNGSSYYFFSFKALSGVIAYGTYTGTGATQSITGVGFTPSAVFVKNGSTTNSAVWKTSDMASTTSKQFGGADATTAITSIDSNGFTLGTGSTVNGSGNTMWWFAFKAGNFNAPLTRLPA